MTWPLPFWVAHRGAGKLAPENTLAAFRVGAQHGYRAFECDVKLSRDGQPFLLHDDTLDRTTAERGIAGARDWAALSRIDAGAWHGRAYAGEMLPSLDAIARFCLANGHALMAKVTAMGCAGSALTAACLAVCDDAFEASAAALIALGIAGEIAAETAAGPVSFAIAIIDALAALDAPTVVARAKVSP